MMINNQTMPDPFPAKIKHSGIGITSFILSILQGIITATTIVAAAIMTTTRPESENEVLFIIVGSIIFEAIFAHLVGVGLGIAGIVQKNRKKIMAILGLVFNACALIAVLLIVILGLLTQ